MVSKSIVVVDNWNFKAVNENDWLPATVPGCVHTDLFHNKKISDPFYGTNELDIQWIDKQDWEYEATFHATKEIMNSTNLELVFNGLDTYADVYLNGQKLLSTNNMFRTWKVDVKEYIQAKNNSIKVQFRSPINEDLKKLERQGYNLPANNDHSEDGGVGDRKLSVFARKAPYHYGWDWGPRFVTSGIWKEVHLVGWTESRITDFFIQQNEISSLQAKLTAVIEVQSEKEWQGTIQLSTQGVNIEKAVQLQAGTNKVEINIEINHPKLWWSRGLGEQHLYDFTAVLLKEDDKISGKSIRTGLRAVRLVREKDEKGASFYFELNGIPVFAKGANHIPNDSFVTNVTYERYRHEIVSAVESNMNMLRVWGGGIYENDEFYELCDEHGILVWQDFMFACSMYPGDEEFLQNIELEAEDNIKRLRNHPSIVLWCGNNEIDLAWSQYNENGGWGWKQQYTPEIRGEIWSDYEAIFHRVLPYAVKKYLPGAEYWPSSPMVALTHNEQQHASNTNTSGDIHYWGVWHALEPFENYNVFVGRFMSEYGFQSFPEEKTVRSYAENHQMELESEVMLHHQKHHSGNRLIKEYMEMYYKEPKDFLSFLYMSQVLQAEGIKMANEAHRRNKPFCMGTLYWQMNDCWPVASWSSMDYHGRWKALQYYAKKSFKDVMISIDGLDHSKVIVHIVTDKLEPVTGSLQLKLYDFNGALLFKTSQSAYVEANSSKVVSSLIIEELLQGHDPTKVVLLAFLEQNGEIVDSKEHYFVPIKNIKLDPPTIKVTEVKELGGSEFILETNVLAKQVWLSAEVEGIFTDNYFDLIPGVRKKIRFLARGIDGVAFGEGDPGKIKIQSMADFIKV